MSLDTAVAIFAVDPGQTTGVATGLLDLGQITVKKAMGRARAKGNLVTWNETGSHVDQAWSLSRRICDYYFNVHIERGLIAFNSFFVVSEDFNLRIMSADLTPVRLNAGLETLLSPAFKQRWGQIYSKQSASEAKSFCSNDMLDRWGLLRGRTPHERDALRHLAKRLDTLL